MNLESNKTISLNNGPLYLIFITLLAITTSCNSTTTDNTTTPITQSKESDSASLVHEIEDEAKPAYIEAFTIVNTIKNEVDLAEQGLLKKQDVISEFNRKLGPEMGRLNTLSQIKRRLDTAGEGYIQFKYIKAKAEIAMRKAAEAKLFEQQ